ncbi:MAG: zinc-ribbon domain-containing protein [Polyangiaceae bacterium]|nr:zinc-ribbon domain-containing protein [Polyangiaceae bacterium]
MSTKRTRMLADAPDLLRLLDRARHPDLDPAAVKLHSTRPLRWRCPAGPDHVWESPPSIQHRCKGCPFCGNWRASITNCLATVAPEIAVEWHPTKNGSLTPWDVVPGTSTEAYWQCAISVHHVWRTRINRRVAGHGCPFCAGKSVSPDNCLSAVAPDLAREWHPTRNGNLTPDGVTRGSSRRVFWRCGKDPSHVWQSMVHERAVKGTGCPLCLGRRPARAWNVASSYPAVAAEWHPTKNGALTPRDVAPGSDRKVWWRCSKNPRHVWQAVVSSRTRRESGCPLCRLPPRRRSLGARKPALAALWHPTKNAPLTAHDVTVNATRNFWWKCPNGPDHEWKSWPRGDRPVPRAGYCPFCRNDRPSVTNSLAARYPALAAEWHPTKNGALTPEKTMFLMRRAAWWRCAAGHAWYASVRRRTLGECGCRACHPAAARSGARREER